jgi:hypothetical protein
VNAAADSGGFLTETEGHATVADPFAKDTGGLVKRWLGSVV